MSRLKEKLRQLHYEAGLRQAAEVANGIGVPAAEMRELDFAASSQLFDIYVDKLRNESSRSIRFAAADSETVQSYLSRLARELDGKRAVWFCLYEDQPVGIELAVAQLLNSAVAFVVTYAGDLMLTSTNADDGICVELNHGSNIDEYEIASWGIFSTEPPRPL